MAELFNGWLPEHWLEIHASRMTDPATGGIKGYVVLLDDWLAFKAMLADHRRVIRDDAGTSNEVTSAHTFEVGDQR